MNTFDIIIAALLLFGFIRGIFKGLFVEIASLVALIGGVYGAIHFSFYASEYLKKQLDWDEHYISLTAFALTFIAIVIIVSLAGKLLTKIADLAALGILNKILGGIFGLLKIAFILSVILSFFIKMNDTIPFVSKQQLKESILILPIKNVAPLIFPNYFDESKVPSLEEIISNEI